MSERRDKYFVVSISALVLILVTLPYIIATQSGGDDFVFNGFLLNPIDGNTYIAKMLQGWEGTWRVKLPFSPDPGSGAFFFLFYLYYLSYKITTLPTNI